MQHLPQLELCKTIRRQIHARLRQKTTHPLWTPTKDKGTLPLQAMPHPIRYGKAAQDPLPTRANPSIKKGRGEYNRLWEVFILGCPCISNLLVLFVYLVSWIHWISTSHFNKPHIPFFLSLHERLVGQLVVFFLCQVFSCAAQSDNDLFLWGAHRNKSKSFL